MILAQSKAIRTVLRWQVVATVVSTLAVGLLAGIHGAISAMLGGLVSICAGLAFSVVVSLSRSDSLAGTLVTAFRAEAVKVTRRGAAVRRVRHVQECRGDRFCRIVRHFDTDIRNGVFCA